MKNTLIKILTLLMVLCFCLGTIFACSNGESGQTPPPASPEHTCEYGEWNSNGDSTHTRVCKTNNEHKQTEDCSGGTATNTERPICEDCGVVYGATLNHTHVFDTKFDTEKFLISTATCMEKAQYYYGCECGAIGTEKYFGEEYAGHEFKALKYDENNHWYECLCGEKDIAENHKGGTVTCKQKAVCETCKQSYGELAHNYENNKCTTCGQEETYSKGLEYELNGEEYSVTGIGACTDTEIIIPSTYDGKPVTSIGDGAFWICTSLKSIEIPNSVTWICDETFSGCTSLTSITFEANSQLENIDNYAFDGCTSLKSIEIPSSVTRIGSFAFRGCTSLTSITFEENIQLKNIGEYTFVGCTSLTSITYNGTVEEWNSMITGYYMWDGQYGVPATEVQCSDGKVSLT